MSSQNDAELSLNPKQIHPNDCISNLYQDLLFVDAQCLVSILGVML